MKTSIITAAISICLAVPLWAHGAGEHVMGQVVSVKGNNLVVKTVEGTTTTLMVTPETVYQKSNKRATLKDLHPGDKVVVDIMDMGSMHHATKVVFGKTK